MADFTPRTFSQILDDMVNYVQTHSTIDDFSVGSTVRTILEAAALEDDEQYFAMTQIMELMSIFNCKGERLRRRVADYGLSPRSASAAVGKVRFYNTALITGRVGADTNSGLSSVALFSSSMFPVSGFPYDVYVAEGTSRSQLLSVTANNTSLATLTFSSPLLNNLIAGDRISLKTGDTTHIITSGAQVMAPATVSSPAKIYTTQETAYIYPGNYASNEVLVKASASGSSGNLASGQISRFAGSLPFNGAAVFSLSSMAGGRDAETDDELLARFLTYIQSLSRGTPLALKAAATGVEQPTTGQRVTSANVIEDFANDEVIVYIDDGTGLTASPVVLPFTTAAGSSVGTTLTLTDGSLFPLAGTIVIQNSTLVTYTSRTGNVLTLSSATTVTIGDTVQFIDYLASSTEAFQTKFRTANFPVVRNTDAVYKKVAPATTWSPLTRGVDYILNKGTGDIKLLSPLPQGSQLFATYSYHTGLIATVQKVLEGDPNDSVNFPGVKAAGISLAVEAPSIRRIVVRLSISAKPGFTEADLYDSVKASVESYISSLKLGEDVILSRIIDSVHNVSGVYSVSVSEPTQNITILESELPVPFASNGDSLVTVV